jgi:hypothetical protein
MHLLILYYRVICQNTSLNPEDKWTLDFYEELIQPVSIKDFLQFAVRKR